MKRLFFLTTIVSLVLPCAGLAQPVRDEVDDYFARVAGVLAKFLDARDEDRIAVSFAPLTGSSTAGIGYTQVLADKLKKHKITVAPQAKFTFKGEFGPAGSKDKEERLALKLNAKVVDALGEPAFNADFSALIQDPRKLGEALGATLADAHKALTGPQFNRRLRESIENPQIFLMGNQLKAGRQSPFAVEVLVKNQPLEPKKENGQAVFSLGLEDEYELRFLNNTSVEAAVAVSVDGLSTFYFAEEMNPATRKPYRYYIVPPRANGEPGIRTVEGWFKTTKRALGFRVVPLEESAAARLGLTSEIGQITVSFHASWDETASRPPSDEPGEPAPPHKPNTRKQTITLPDGTVREVTLMEVSAPTSVGTGFGTERITNGAGVVRVIGAVRDQITLRYTGRKD